MTQPEYGSVTTMEEIQPGVVMITESTFHRDVKVNKKTILTQKLKVKRMRDVVTEWLKMQDLWKTGEIANPGLCVEAETPDGIRIKKTWTLPTSN